MSNELEQRARLHAALGDPARLAIVDDLRDSDRSPAELVERLDTPSNLLAHHLGVLERVGLIERTVSTADRRRRYITLRHDRLSLVDPATSAPATPVLFVCTHNSARSQLAAAMWTARIGTPARSAGTHPADRVHPLAVAAGRRADLDLSGSTPSTLASTSELAADTRTITVCDRAHEELDRDVHRWHWSIPDPAVGGQRADFDLTVDQLERRIGAQRRLGRGTL